MNANFGTPLGNLWKRPYWIWMMRDLLKIVKHSNHPSIRLIHKYPEHHYNFSFKHLNPSEPFSISSIPKGNGL